MAKKIKTAAQIATALLFTASWFHAGYAETLTAREVMTRADERYDGDTSISHATMVLIDERERQRVRQLKIYSKDYGDNEKSLSVFESPADIKGTSYLNVDWDDPDRDDDSWLYLPALQDVKRLATGDKSDPFLGSDFTYSDMNGFELEWYDYNFINESEMVDGHDCWMIEIVPKAQYKEKSEDATGYLKSHFWIRKDNFVQVKAKIWVKRGKRIKYFSAADIRQIDGIWTPMKMQMITTKNDKREHASVFQFSEVTYNQPLDDNLFRSETMERNVN